MKSVRERMIELGFVQRMPYHYRWEGDSYVVIEGNKDSHDHIIYTIESKRYQSCSYRGIILDGSEFDFIYSRVKEDYDQTVEGTEIANKILMKTRKGLQES